MCVVESNLSKQIRLKILIQEKRMGVCGLCGVLVHVNDRGM